MPYNAALTLKYNGRNYPKHLMSPRAKGFTSVVIQKLTGSSNNINGTFYISPGLIAIFKHILGGAYIRGGGLLFREHFVLASSCQDL